MVATVFSAAACLGMQSPSHAVNEPSTEDMVKVKDAVGTHLVHRDDLGGSAGWLSPSLERKASQIGTRGWENCGSGAWGGGYNVSLSNGFYELMVRAGSCTSAPAVGAHTTGQVRKVTISTHGQFICRGSFLYGYGTSVWHHTEGYGVTGWSWAGGTTSPRWDYHKEC